MSDADIINSGDFLRLSDAQVRKMIKGKTMFEYTISIALRRNENGTEKVVPIHPKPDAQTSEISTQTVANLNAVWLLIFFNPIYFSSCFGTITVDFFNLFILNN